MSYTSPKSNDDDSFPVEDQLDPLARLWSGFATGHHVRSGIHQGEGGDSTSSPQRISPQPSGSFARKKDGFTLYSGPTR